MREAPRISRAAQDPSFPCGALYLDLPPQDAHAQISYVGSASTPADNGAQAGPGPITVIPPTMQAGDFVLIIGASRNATISISQQEDRLGRPDRCQRAAP